MPDSHRQCPGLGKWSPGLLAVGNGFGHHVSKRRVDGCLNGSFPARGSAGGQCIGAHLVSCVTLVFTVLAHQGLAWHIIGDFQSALCPAPVILQIPPAEQMICQKSITGWSEWGMC